MTKLDVDLLGITMAIRVKYCTQSIFQPIKSTINQETRALSKKRTKSVRFLLWQSIPTWLLREIWKEKVGFVIKTCLMSLLKKQRGKTIIVYYWNQNLLMMVNPLNMSKIYLSIRDQWFIASKIVQLVHQPSFKERSLVWARLILKP